jgi:hypothetical protein
MFVSLDQKIKKLQAFADQNKQTQGKFTIGDEKVRAGSKNISGRVCSK